MCNVDEPVGLLGGVRVDSLAGNQQQLVFVPDPDKAVAPPGRGEEGPVRRERQVEDRVGRANAPYGFPVTTPAPEINDVQKR